MQKKRGFTLIEVLIVIFVFATGVMIVVQGVNKTTGYISEMTQRTIAMNLAKEGIEAMYNIRNTNWRKRSSEKDKCWLNADPTSINCDEVLKPGRWVISVLKKDSTSLHTHSTFLTPIRMESRIEEDSKHFQDLSAFKNRLKDFDIKYPGEEGMKMENMDHHNKHNRYYLPYVKGYGWISVPDFQQLKLQDPNIKDEPISGEYRRYISLDQVKNKNDSCSDINCAKELMFCSIVFYTHPYQGIVKICSIMTNFQK